MVNKASCNKIKNWNCYVMLKQKIRWIKEYGPIRPYSVILVIMWQHDHGTNKYVKWMILGPKDEAQSPSKAKWRKNSRNVELDEFNIKLGVGVTRKFNSATGEQVKKVQRHRLNRRYKEGVSALVLRLPLSREHIKHWGTKSPALVEPTVWEEAPVQWRKQ